MNNTVVLAGVTAVLYFSEGLPYGIVKEFAPMYLRFAHVDLTSIGLLNIVSGPSGRRILPLLNVGR